jgi:alanine racemase
MTKTLPTWVEIDLDRLRQNLAVIRSGLGTSRILLVVKADAYGHGAAMVAREAMAADVEIFGVATLHEGIELRRAGITSPILILSPCLQGEADEIVAHDLRCTVHGAAFAARLAQAARAAQKTVVVHLEVDTGMGRSGLTPEEAMALVPIVDREPGLRLEGIYTHFPDADGPNLDFAHEQLRRFAAYQADLAATGIAVPIAHAANSAGLARVPAARLDLVRPGLLAYGLRPHGAPADLAVEPVMAFKSRLVQVRQLPAGHPVSYGRTYITPRAMRIGVVAAGYGHGLPRALSNRGEMLVRGKRVPILGRVTMDMTMVSLEGTPEAEVEDEVVIFGSQGNTVIPIEEVAAVAGTIPYEIMCAIGKRVPRVYRRGNTLVKVSTLIGERRGGEAGGPVDYALAPSAAVRGSVE